MSKFEFPPELLEQIEAVKASGAFTTLSMNDLAGVSGGAVENAECPIFSDAQSSALRNMLKYLKALGMSYEDAVVKVMESLGLPASMKSKCTEIFRVSWNTMIV